MCTRLPSEPLVRRWVLQLSTERPCLLAHLLPTPYPPHTTLPGPYTGPYGQPLHGVVHLVKREEWDAVKQDEGVGDPKSG